MRTAAVLTSFLLVAAPALAIDYIVRNACPAPIEWFAAGVSQGTLATGDSALRLDQGTSPGFIYTTANGGLVNGNLVAARAGFFFEPNYWYYYLVRDPNSNNLNTGISVTPQPDSQRPILHHGCLHRRELHYCLQTPTYFWWWPTTCRLGPFPSDLSMQDSRHQL
ncbi:hypothetical protein BKA70DRAFT_827190 [Coprinopsis sp. MPI-PUGE-AT-0042]|nr:hypothetical protein BKA70DRAFT_827190 [Coprinopsis sp. MPI-PUGE-AT-0042]